MKLHYQFQYQCKCKVDVEVLVLNILVWLDFAAPNTQHFVIAIKCFINLMSKKTFLDKFKMDLGPDSTNL